MHKGFYKLMALALAAFSGFVSFAEGASTEMPTFSSQVVTDFTDVLKNSVAQLVNIALPVVGAVLGGALIIWGIIVLVRVVKRAFSSGSGR